MSLIPRYRRFVADLSSPINSREIERKILFDIAEEKAREFSQYVYVNVSVDVSLSFKSSLKLQFSSSSNSGRSAL